jgi:hypothetical protein
MSRIGKETHVQENTMLQRVLCIGLAALVLGFFASAPAYADEKTHEGKIVEVKDGKLTMTDKDGKNKHTHKVMADAKITCDDKECKLEDLKEGCLVTVTAKDDDDQSATKIVARTKEKDKN